MAEARPFRVLGIAQVAIGGPDRTALRHLWSELLGFEIADTIRSDGENVEEDVAHAPGDHGGVELSLMTPLDPERPPRVHVPPLNHVGLWIDDLDAAVAWLGAKGVRFAPGGIRRGAHGHRICFIHPKGSEEHPVGGGGVLIELVEAPDSVAAPSVSNTDASP